MQQQQIRGSEADCTQCRADSAMSADHTRECNSSAPVTYSSPILPLAPVDRVGSHDQTDSEPFCIPRGAVGADQPIGPPAGYNRRSDGAGTQCEEKAHARPEKIEVVFEENCGDDDHEDDMPFSDPRLHRATALTGPAAGDGRTLADRLYENAHEERPHTACAPCPSPSVRPRSRSSLSMRTAADWTDEQMDRLDQLVRDTMRTASGDIDWDEISAQHGRSADSCLRRYQNLRRASPGIGGAHDLRPPATTTTEHGTITRAGRLVRHISSAATTDAHVSAADDETTGDDSDSDPDVARAHTDDGIRTAAAPRWTQDSLAQLIRDGDEKSRRDECARPRPHLG